MADLTVLARRVARPPRSGDDGRCFGPEPGSTDIEPRATPTPVVLVWDVADTREEADAECICFAVVSRLLLLGLLLGGYCGRWECISC